MEAIENSAGIEYTVGLVDGRRKYGLVLRRKTENDQVIWQFVPMNRVKDYSRSKDITLVEMIPDSMVSFIDCYSY
jgi:hypothetical protein